MWLVSWIQKKGSSEIVRVQISVSPWSQAPGPGGMVGRGVCSLAASLPGFPPSHFMLSIPVSLGFPGGSVVKNPPANAGDVDLIPGSGRSPEEGNGTYLGILTWKITWTEEPGRPQSMESQKSWPWLRSKNNFFVNYLRNYLPGRSYKHIKVYTKCFTF